MTTATQPAASVKPARKPRKPPARSVSLLEPPAADSDGWFAVRLTVGKDSNVYLVRQVPCDFGEAAYAIEKLDDDLNVIETYDVLFANNESSCSCAGQTFNSKCKHLDGLRKLDELGQLPRPLRQKMSACNRCCRVTDGPLCAACEEEDAYFTACDQAAEMEAGGIDPWDAGDAWEPPYDGE